MSKKMNVLDWIATILVLVGGINWGLVALNYNLVEALLGSWQIVVKVVYGLVGLSAIYSAVRLFWK